MGKHAGGESIQLEGGWRVSIHRTYFRDFYIDPLCKTDGVWVNLKCRTVRLNLDVGCRLVVGFTFRPLYP